MTNEAEGVVDRSIAKNRPEYAVLIVSGDGSDQAYGVRGFPSSYLISADGRVAWAGHPANLKAAMIEAELARTGGGGVAPEPPRKPASEIIDLRVRHVAGDRWAFTRDTAVRSRLRLDDGREVEVAVVLAVSGVVTVLEAAADPTAVRVEFAPECVRTCTSPRRGKENIPLPYAGRTVTVRRGRGLEVQVESDAPLNAGEKLDLKQYIAPAPEVPSVEVRVGDGFSVPCGPTFRLIDATVDFRGDIRYDLKAVRPGTGAARVAEFALSGEVRGMLGSVAYQLAMTGRVLSEMPNGESSGDSAGQGPVSGETEVPVPGGAALRRVSGTSEFSMRWSVKPLPPDRAAAAGGAGAGPAPAVGDIPTPEVWYIMLLTALRKGDFDAFERLHTRRAHDSVSREGFARLVAQLRALGSEGKFKPLSNGDVQVQRADGGYLTILKKAGASWKADDAMGEE